MRMRDLLTSGVFLTVLVVHFSMQWYAWKVHIEAVPAEEQVVDSGQRSWWGVCSYPLFTLVPRRTQNLHFYELLVANSVVWAVLLSWVTYGSLRRWSTPRRRARQRVAATAAASKASASALTRTDRLVELKRLLDQELITREEYQQRRATILTEV